jgi:hypothetical protein
MEITHPGDDQSSPWYVTNGLLVVELMTGNLQLGDSLFDQHAPSKANVAGDPDDPHGPTYAGLAGLRDRARPVPANSIVETVSRDGSVGVDERYARRSDVRDEHWVETTRQWVASPFWAFMHSSGPIWDGNGFVTAPLFESPFYATGLPITDAYWATVRVDGTPRDVLLQCFERRCLTYTPDNPTGWQVEAGNVGQHYYAWRYDGPQETPTATPTATVEPTTPSADVLYQTSFDDWPVITTNFGSTGYPGDGIYQIRSYRSASLYAFSDASFGDASYNVDVRRDWPTGSARACLTIRAETFPTGGTLPKHSYDVCLHSSGGDATHVSVSYRELTGTSDSPTLQTTELGSFTLPAPLPAQEWAALRVDAAGPSLTVFVNGRSLGTVQHGALASGKVAISAAGSSVDGTVVLAFRNLVVRRLP